MKIPSVEIDDNRLKEISACGLWMVLGAVLVASIWIPQYREDLFSARQTMLRQAYIIQRQMDANEALRLRLQEVYAWVGLRYEGTPSYPAEARQ